ncbi:glycoside hydrolase family 3 protein [Marinoscillum pacificum]|uniref:glycoside hydrolase family 3 protein n=1 Tax=Marinoscillum pacificum TaxID=392723 RepID=UPI002158461F|nr:glycoside hydrolase family 3 protein [Marinoscillum pacificum]
MMNKPLQLLLMAWALGCAISVSAQSYLDESLTNEERARDLVSQLTLEEKVQQMVMNAPAVDRLNIPPYDWWNEALHGVGRAGIATVFPQAVGLGATFDEDLAYRVSSAIADEARAMYNAASKNDNYLRYSGLTFWTPNVNIFRDPRWGRGQETYGEDPFLTSRLGVAFVKGLQGDHPKYLKTAACGKHFAVHSGPERLRHEFDAIASPKDMFETYLPAFKALVDADVESIMCAYNRTNGEACCAHQTLLGDLLREQWGFDGHILSDCWAIVDFFAENGHGLAGGPAEASAMAVKSGVSLNCGDSYPALVEAVEKGLITEQEIDEALVKLLVTRFKLGMFDSDDSNPYNKIGQEVVNSPENRALAKEAALKSIVLLKNNGVLPMRNDFKRYFVTGPNAATINPLIGNYFGVNPNMVTFLEGIAGAISPASQVQYNTGTFLETANNNPIDWASPVAATSEATFMVMGLTGDIEGEEGAAIASEHYGDRLDYNIPQNQIDYLRKLKNGNDNAVIAIVTGGSPMNLAEVHEIADAVLLVWYPGEEGGNAVADIVFGEASPSGRLPITFPKSLDQLPAYEDYSMVGRTYKYMSQEPLYPFGFGLSYSKIEYGNLSVSANKIKEGEEVEVTVKVTNTGETETEEVVQMYLTDDEASVRVPFYDLKGVKRVNLEAGESTLVKFVITSDMLKLIDEEGVARLEKGSFTVSIGGSLPTQRSLDLGASSFVTTKLQLK